MGGGLEAFNEDPESRRIGPRKIVRLTCKGCPALITGYWKDYLENDETDSGTDAKCTAVESGKHITPYWHSETPVPKWCPIKEDL